MDELTLTGTILKYGIPSKNGFVIPKECELTIPKKIPVVWNYEFFKPENIIGSTGVQMLDDRIDVTFVSTHKIFNTLMADLGKIYCGGYYKGIKTHKEGDILIVDRAYLQGIGVFLKGDDWLYLKIKDNMKGERL